MKDEARQEELEEDAEPSHADRGTVLELFVVGDLVEDLADEGGDPAGGEEDEGEAEEGVAESVRAT